MPLLGTSVEAIDLAEDRGRFGALLAELGYKAPPYATARSVAAGAGLRRARSASRCSCAPPTCSAGARWRSSTRATASPTTCAARASPTARRARRPGPEIFLDRFLENATEVDVDALCDGREVWIGGIMQHVEEAGVHSGDSACVLPPHSLGEEMLEQIRAATREIALAIGVVGLINVQYAVHAGELYVIEANPRASRTVPFVSKAVGLPLAKLACRIMLGESIAEMELPREREGIGFGDHVSRQGGRAAVRPLRGLRRAARPGDALDRRGDGHRARLPHGVRQGAGRRRRCRCPARARRSSPSPTPTRPARSPSRRSCTTTALRSSPRAAPPKRSRAWACRRSASTRSARARRTCSTGSSAATSTSSSTRRPASARAPTAMRSAAPPCSHGIPCLTTLVRRRVRRARDRQRAARRRARGAVPAGAARRHAADGVQTA